MAKKERYYLNKDGEFVIENYHLAKPFASFFPGIAGATGVPIWVFYVNRGQAIASFGIKDKDHPVMEFLPANKAYQFTPLVGFRTFIKIPSPRRRSRGGLNLPYFFYDAFHNGISSLSFEVENQMRISPHELNLKEINHTLGLEVEILYFPIPNDNYGALTRRLTIKNLTREKRSLEVLDGMPRIIPYGLSNMFLKKLSRTVEAWMGVENLDSKVPYLRLKVDPTDGPETIHIKEGNFYCAFNKRGLIRPVVDPEAIFGQSGDFGYPRNFLNASNWSYPKDQLTKSRTPCCMSHVKMALSRDGSDTLYSIIGNMDTIGKLKKDVKRITDERYLTERRLQNRQLIENLQSTVFTHSSSRHFDLYSAQNFLDNLMRGGYPLFLEGPSGEEGTHLQVFSRKHGDLERDYNKFLIEPTYFSQGNGNFRDVNQNRRCDIWFHPGLKDEAVFTFFNLLQTDGYNPLVIKPARFIFRGDFDCLRRFFKNSARLTSVRMRLKKAFSPGELFLFIEQNNIRLTGRKEDFLAAVLADSIKSVEAEHGEGFWSDHWSYCLDLLEAYLSLYPENLRQILLDKREFTFYDNAAVVNPRHRRYILKGNRIHQYHGVVHHHGKSSMIRKRRNLAHISRAKNGHGEIYTTSLIVKMLVVIANKFATLDPFGVGIEMEADKPNWYDALNGLPGVLGSSTCETFELKRWILFLQSSIKRLGLAGIYTIGLPREVYELLTGLGRLSGKRLDNYKFWDRSQTLKEAYRRKTLMGFSGAEREIGIKALNNIFDRFLKKLDIGLKKAYDSKKGLYYSYFINEVMAYEIISNRHEQLRRVRPLKFRQKPLPLFLEGIVHYLRVSKSRQDAKRHFFAVRRSELFDKRLKMYKVSASLKDMPAEIGRCCIFTPGWLENESIWLHMEYKYLLELLRCGLYNEFYDDFLNVLIPFQDPQRYGRSILENSSFIVPSVFPQKKLHGAGFVARLSGSTAEFVNIWLIMCAGHNPFYLDKDNKLCLALRPILASWLFSKRQENGFPKDTFAFKFLNKTLVVYHNPNRRDTFGKRAVKATQIIMTPFSGQRIILKSSYIPAPLSYDVRDSKIARIDIMFGDGPKGDEVTQVSDTCVNTGV